MAEAANDHEELVKVFDTDEESEAMVVRGLLESAGIDAITQNREAPQDILPGRGWRGGNGAARSSRGSLADHRGVPPKPHYRRRRGRQ